MRNLPLIMLMLIIVSSCTKKPEAFFTWYIVSADDPYYKCDTATFPDCKVVAIINQSIHTEFYEYTAPGSCQGTSVECLTIGPNPILTYLQKGSYTVELTAYSEEHKKEDKHAETIVID